MRANHTTTPAVNWLLAVMLLALCVLNAPAVEFYLAPDGKDSHPGTKDQPFATLPRAMEAVREAKTRIAQGSTPAGPVHVILRGGVYPVRETIRFTPPDSGSADAPVTYQSAPGEHAVLSGGERLSGTWSQTPGKPFWQLDVAAARQGKWVFSSLYVNGESRTRARHPNYGEKELRAESAEPGGDPRQSLRYFPGDVDPSWSNQTDIDVVLLQSWTPTIHRIREILPDRRAIRFFSAHVRPVDFWERNFRYYLANVFEALDEPGEWYLNRHSGTLYYHPLPGEDLTKAEFIAPVLKSPMIEFAGDLAGAGIEHLHFRGLRIHHLEGDMDRYNGVYRQGHMFLGAAVTARGLRHSSFEGCQLAHLGEYALELGDGCQDVAVRQCHFYDLGAGAMQLGVSDLGALKTPLAPGSRPGPDVVPQREVRGLVIDNNCIHRLGTLWHGCYGIVNRFASETKITHNEIFDTHWDAIGLDARWSWKGEKYSHGNEVAYNHLHHLGLRYHTDAAGIYQFGPLDTHIHHNLIHDTVAYPYICGFAGIYLDEQSRNALVENNVVYNVDWYAYFQNKGTDNLFRNNIGAFARDGFIGRGGLDTTWPANYFEVFRNLYIARDGIAVAKTWQPGERPPKLHQNLYHTLAKDTPLTFAGQLFPEWQASGQDEKSVVADPGCHNPAAFDFSLSPDASACKSVGFVPFDEEIRKAGLHGEQAWKDTPKAYALRQPSKVWAEEDFAKLNAFTLDCSLFKDGEKPTVFRITDPEGTGIAITSEVPGIKGPRCLKIQDKQGLSKTFYPYLQVIPRGLKTGAVRFTCAVRQPGQEAARIQIGFRGAGETPASGPSLDISSGGVVKAGGKPIVTLQSGAWTRFEFRFALGGTGQPVYTLLTHGGTPGESAHTLPFPAPTFADIGWIGITTPDDAGGICYLDDLSLTLEEAPLTAVGSPSATSPAKAADPAPEVLRSELAVIGGGSGGFGAALAAARAGVDVLLVEAADSLGGTSVRGGVNCWEPGVGGTGFPFELYQRLRQIPNAIGIYTQGRHMMTYDASKEPYRFPGGESVIDPARTYLDTLVRSGLPGLPEAEAKRSRREQWHGVPFEPEAVAKTMLEMLAETGHCRVLFKARCVGARADAQRVQSVKLADGRLIEASYFVDATGDGVVCVAAGCEEMSGQESRERFGEPDAPEESTTRVNGATLLYRITPVADPRIEPLPEGISPDCWWAKRFPVAQFNQYPNGDLNVNMLPTMEGNEFIQLGYPAAVDECRKRVHAHWHHLQSNYAEFARYRLDSVAPGLGIRETRRIVGEVVLTEHDLLAGISGQKHEDIICLADHAMDTHGSHSRIGELKEPYGVPYRSLIPKGRRNLLIACRAASFSSLAASSCRLSRTMMQMGQAAGTAVALARKLQVDLPEVPPAALRDELRRQHVQLEHPMPPELRAYLTGAPPAAQP